MKQLDVNDLPKPKVFDNVTKSLFEEQIVPLYQPVVLKSFAKDWPLIQAARISANEAKQYLFNKAGQCNFPLVSLPETYGGRLFYSEDFRQMNFTVQQQSMKEGLHKMGVGHGARHCFQCVPVQQGFPNLFSECINPLVPESTSRFIWFGDRFVVAPHFDEADNIAVVACGKRRFTFFPPEQVSNLYIGPLDHTPAGQPISLVDINQPDLEKYPRYREAFEHGLSMELEPGDAVYIPSPWWHHVEALSDFNVLINYWWSSAKVSSALPLPMLGHVLQVVGNLPEPQKRAWQDYINHFAFADRQQVTEHIPEHAQGVLGKLNDVSIGRLHNWLKQTFTS